MTTTNHPADPLYTTSDIDAMRHAEAARLPGQNRVAEIMAYARQMGITRIGIACCISLKKEALQLESLLTPEFQVVLIDCKTGSLDKQQLMGGSHQGIACNPSQQAHHLAEHHTQLNIAFGLCIGHDLIFNQKSTAPVTTLIVKDRQHRHHPYKTFEKP